LLSAVPSGSVFDVFSPFPVVMTRLRRLMAAAPLLWHPRPFSILRFVDSVFPTPMSFVTFFFTYILGRTRPCPWFALLLLPLACPGHVFPRFFDFSGPKASKMASARCSLFHPPPFPSPWSRMLVFLWRQPWLANSSFVFFQTLLHVGRGTATLFLALIAGVSCLERAIETLLEPTFHFVPFFSILCMFFFFPFFAVIPSELGVSICMQSCWCGCSLS